MPDGQWYLHLFDSAQPDLNWTSPRGPSPTSTTCCASGSTAASTGSGSTSATAWSRTRPSRRSPARRWPRAPRQQAPYWDQEGVHDLHRRWRSLADSYADRPRMLCGEVNVPVERAVRYVRPDELHQVFNWPFLVTHWDAARAAGRGRRVDRRVRRGRRGPDLGARQPRHPAGGVALRLPARRGAAAGSGRVPCSPTSRSGLRRARAAALLMLALPGSAYVYQGDELGLPEHTTSTTPTARTRRSRGRRRGPRPRRLPRPAALGGGRARPGLLDGRPWLPQPPAYAALARDRAA